MNDRMRRGTPRDFEVSTSKRPPSQSRSMCWWTSGCRSTRKLCARSESPSRSHAVHGSRIRIGQKTHHASAQPHGPTVSTVPAPSARKIGIMICRFLICRSPVGDRAHVGDPSWRVSCACAWSRTRRAHAGGGGRSAPLTPPHPCPSPSPRYWHSTSRRRLALGCNIPQGGGVRIRMGRWQCGHT